MKRTLILTLLLMPLLSYGAGVGDVRLNEFLPQPSSGSGWVELINASSSDINLAGWSLTHLVVDNLGSTTVATTTFPGLLIPAGGLVSFDQTLGTSSDELLLQDNLGAIIYGMTYGGIDDPNYDSLGASPAVDHSAYSLGSGGGGPWMITGSTTRNWFNQDPTKQSIIDALSSAGVTTNLSTSSDWTNITGLSLLVPSHGSFVWPGSLNLTGSADRSVLQNSSTSINFGTGAINLAGTLASTTHNFTSLVPTTTPVTEPVTPPISSGGGGGGGGGGGSSSVATSVATTSATTTAPILPDGRVLGESTFRFYRYLRLGLRGPDVIELQKRLKLEGFLLVKSPTNYFGLTTKKAVMAYQKKYKIKPITGVAAKATLAKLNAVISSLAIK